MTRSLRLLLRFVAALSLLLAAGWFGAGPASAATEDSFDSYQVDYTVTTEGVLKVRETVVLRFGSNSGRHGYDRYLITREPQGEQDALYEVSNVSVSSPSGVSTTTTTSTQTTGTRQQAMRIRIGDPNRTITTPTATYVISYDVRGAMRSAGSYDELYWDVTGSSMPVINKAKVTVTVPGGVQAVTCSAAAPGKQGPCTTSRIQSDETALFEQTRIPKGQLLTVSAKIKPGLITDNKPHLVEPLDAAEKRLTLYSGIGSGVIAVLAPLFGWLFYRRHGYDRRYAGLPPGVLPAQGDPATEVPNRPPLEVPVSFAPPKIPLAEAGMLLDGQSDVRHTTATLVGMAVSGAIKLRSDEEPQATLVDPNRVPDEPSELLMRSLFAETPVVDLTEAGGIHDAHEQLSNAVKARAAEGGWFRSRAVAGGCLPVAVLGMIGMGAMVLFSAGHIMFVMFPALISIGATVTILNSKLARGQRTGYGRALTDQVEGFRTYIATAEAEQLRFEEGEDIFSKYLPWAILFNLTDRWTRICQRLVELGRLSEQAPYWYYGSSWDLYHVAWSMNHMNDYVSTAVTPPPSMSSDTGWGGGSSFGGGGGFSGGGGGGGGGGSW